MNFISQCVVILIHLSPPGKNLLKSCEGTSNSSTGLWSSGDPNVKGCCSAEVAGGFTPNAARLERNAIMAAGPKRMDQRVWRTPSCWVRPKKRSICKCVKIPSTPMENWHLLMNNPPSNWNGKEKMLVLAANAMPIGSRPHATTSTAVPTPARVTSIHVPLQMLAMRRSNVS